MVYKIYWEEKIPDMKNGQFELLFVLGKWSTETNMKIIFFFYTFIIVLF